VDILVRQYGEVDRHRLVLRLFLYLDRLERRPLVLEELEVDVDDPLLVIALGLLKLA
jgi:hypothetical protein